MPTNESDGSSALPVGHELLALANKWTFLLADYAAAENRIREGTSASRPLPKGMKDGKALEQYRDRCWNALCPVNERLRIAAEDRGIDSSPLRDLMMPWRMEMWKPAMRTVDRLTAIAIAEIERLKTATPRYEDFASWGPPDLRLASLQLPLADAFEFVHRAAHQAAWVHHFIGGGGYKEKPVEDVKQFDDKLRFVDLPKARSCFKVVEAELIAVRQQIPCAHAAALAYAEAVAAAATVHGAEVELSPEEKWRAIHHRLRSMAALDGEKTTDAMKAEVVDAAKARTQASLSPAAASDGVTGQPAAVFYAAAFYKTTYGIQPARLRKAKARGAITTKVVRKRPHYSFEDVKRLWPEDVTAHP